MVELITYSDPNRMILARIAAEYLSKPDITNAKRPLQLLRRGHTSIFRHVPVTFYFRTSLVVRDHLFRYTTAAMAAAGLRINTAQTFIDPVLPATQADQQSAIHQAGMAALHNYTTLIHENSIRMQDARYAVPCGVEVSYIMTFNFLTLMQAVFPQRLWEPGAQAETRETVQQMWDLVVAQDASLWETARDKFGPEAIRWEHARGWLKRHHPDLWDQLLATLPALKSMWDGQEPPNT